MSSQGRPRRADAERNRERVLASAEIVLARDGLPVSMRAVAAHAGVGLGTIYRNFPTQEALYQSIIVQRTQALIAEAAELSTAPEPGRAFLAYFTRIVAHATRTKAMADLLARAGIDPKSGLADVGQADVGQDMRQAVQGLLTRAQHAGAIRADLQMPELMALLTATCLAAEASQWDAGLRTRTLAIVFDGMRAQPPAR
jgi:AcrR family transcriptional regulator